jgi:MoxR-like ATPase
MNYNKKFDPEKPSAPVVAPTPAVAGDRRDGVIYVYRPEIVLAVNVALVTRRPLLLRGPSGSGKSSLARKPLEDALGAEEFAGEFLEQTTDFTNEHPARQ